MATVAQQPSSARRLLDVRFDAAIDAAIAGKPLYPNGAEFVAADMPGLGRVLAECARRRSTVVLIYGDGEERIIAPLPEPGRWQSVVRAVRRVAGRVRAVLRA
jgi:hypothetical protein